MATSDEDLIAMGADPDAIKTAREEIDDLSKKTEEQIAEDNDISLTETKYFKKSIKKGQSRRKNKNDNNKKISNPVTASGSISTSKK